MSPITRLLCTLTRLVAAIGLVALLAACATPARPVIPYSRDKVIPAGVPTHIGIHMAPIPTADTEFPGASCLLCIATARGYHSKLTDHVRTWPTADLASLGQQIGEQLRKQGATVTLVDDPKLLTSLSQSEDRTAGRPELSYKPLADRLAIDRLLVISIKSVGVQRLYSAYVPTDVPRAMIEGTAYIVDLRTNEYQWYRQISTFRKAEGNWDEAPDYPGLTNAYFQAIEATRDTLLNVLKN